MTNAEKYNFQDFTLSAYADLLDIAKKNYTFRSFHDFNKNEKYVIWRHDVDISMHSSRNLARIEADKGVKAIYFILMHSEFYNLFEKEVSDLVHEIIEMGHYIGLHFDSCYYGIKDASELEKHITSEKKILENFFHKEIFAFSFHNTTSFTMSCQEDSYGGLINPYSSYFQKQVGYCSDSNGYWRFNRLKEVLEQATHPQLQVLTHDAWWQQDIMSPRQKIWRSIDGRADKTRRYYTEALARINRENIDW